MDIMILWNFALSVFVAIIGFFLKEKLNELQRVTILLNRTREEIARDNVTQAEMDKFILHMDARFDKLNDKLDAYMKEQRSALN